MGLSFQQLRAANTTRSVRFGQGGGGVERWSVSDWVVHFVGEFGEACNLMKKQQRARDGVASNAAHETDAYLQACLAEELADAQIYLDLLAEKCGVDLGAAVIEKFNRTSAKLGFPERLGQKGDGDD